MSDIRQNVPVSGFVRAPEFVDTYANTFRVSNSISDFTLIFGSIDDLGPGHMQHSDRVSVHISPQMLKMIAMQLTANVAAYEEAYGPLRVSKSAETSFREMRDQLVNVFKQQAGE